MNQVVIQAEIIQAAAFVHFIRLRELNAAMICTGATWSHTILLLLFIEKHNEPDIMKLNSTNTFFQH